MTKLNFDSQGRFIGVEDNIFPKEEQSRLSSSNRQRGYSRPEHKYSCQICGRSINHRGNCLGCNIKNKKEEKKQEIKVEELKETPKELKEELKKVEEVKEAPKEKKPKKEKTPKEKPSKKKDKE